MSRHPTAHLQVSVIQFRRGVVERTTLTPPDVKASYPPSPPVYRKPQIDTVYTHGAGANANVIKRTGTAIASVNSPSGASAYAYTDGINRWVYAKNGGSAGVSGGTAWAKTRNGMAVAHSTAAQRRANRRSALRSPKVFLRPA